MKKYTFLMLIVLMMASILWAQNPPPSRPRYIDWPTVAQYVKDWMAINGFPIDPNGTVGVGKSVRIATNGSNNQTLASDGSGGTKWISVSGYTNLTSFVDQTANRFFGSDASGDVKERTAAQMLNDLGLEADPSVYAVETAPVEVQSAGTVYTLTASTAAVDFGTTDPNVTLIKAGTWQISIIPKFDWVTATNATEKTLSVTINRRNNTPAIVFTAPVYTTPILYVASSATCGTVPMVFTLKTANTTDIIGINAWVSGVPDAGSITCTSVRIVAVWLNSTSS